MFSVAGSRRFEQFTNLELIAVQAVLAEGSGTGETGNATRLRKGGTKRGKRSTLPDAPSTIPVRMIAKLATRRA